MIPLSRLAAILTGALGGWCPLAFAQTTVAASGSAATSPELEAFLASLSKWSLSASIQASYGYNDNLLLSAANEERSGFVRGGMDFILLRAAQDDFIFNAYGVVKGTHYFSAQTSDRDAMIRVRTEGGYRFGEAWKISLPVTAYYQDQVFDVSDTDVERLVAKLKVKGAFVTPTLRWDFHPSWWVEAQATGHRKRFDDGVNDSESGEGLVSVGWVRGKWLEATVSGMQRWRDYDHRAQYSAAGRELRGTRLKISEQDLEARLNVIWDEAEHWETTTRASELRYRDNGSGYFSYREHRVAQEAEWTNKPWLVRLEGSAARLDYSVQREGIGIDPPKRIKDEFAVDFLVERAIGKRWAVFGAYSWERSRSNDLFTSYRVNEGLLGLRWKWDN